MTYTRVHTKVTFANPFLVCGECRQRAEGFHDPERCGCESGWHLTPCGHVAAAEDTCPSWGPVDGCRCVELAHKPATPTAATQTAAALAVANQAHEAAQRARESGGT